jgi:hypothetical protein
MVEYQNVQQFEVRELTDGVWDGLELVVVEVPVKKRKKERKGEPNVQMRWLNTKRYRYRRFVR